MYESIAKIHLNREQRLALQDAKVEGFLLSIDGQPSTLEWVYRDSRARLNLPAVIITDESHLQIFTHTKSDYRAMLEKIEKLGARVDASSSYSGEISASIDPFKLLFVAAELADTKSVHETTRGRSQSRRNPHAQLTATLAPVADRYVNGDLARYVLCLASLGAIRWVHTVVGGKKTVVYLSTGDRPPGVFVTTRDSRESDFVEAFIAGKVCFTLGRDSLLIRECAEILPDASAAK
jgi:hypothetical protein